MTGARIVQAMFVSDDDHGKNLTTNGREGTRILCRNLRRVQRRRKFFQRLGERLRVEVGDGLREFEKLVQLRVRLVIIFGREQTVEREHETLRAAGVQWLRGGSVAEIVACCA